MKAHSSIGASSASRWMACPGSVPLSDGIVSRSSAYALEGTAAHQLAESCLVEEYDPSYYLGSNMVVSKDGATVEVPVTQDMVDAVKVYVDYVRENDTFHTLVEHKFHLKDLHPDLYGTADCVQYFEDTKVLRVTDYKHGQGVAVEAVGNKQGMYYALGALLTLRFPAHIVEIVIVQPRCAHADGPIRSWSIPVIDLLDWQADLLDAVREVERAEVMLADCAPDAKDVWAKEFLQAGDHCKFCPAAGIPGRCAAVEQKQQALARVEFQPLLAYDPAKLAQALHDIPAVEARIKAIREFAYAEAEAGRCPPGFKLVEKRANRKWRNEDEAFEVLGRNGGPFAGATNELYERKFKSPAQVEKLLPKEHRAILADLTVKESSGHTLAPADDKREAVKLSAKDEFSSAPLLSENS